MGDFAASGMSGKLKYLTPRGVFPNPWLTEAFGAMLGRVEASARAASQVIVFEVFCGDLGKRSATAEEKFEVCKKLIPTAHGHPVVFAPVFDHSPFQDMAGIAAADHVIITAGTFGWWPAYTNRRGVVLSLNMTCFYRYTTRTVIHYTPYIVERDVLLQVHYTHYSTLYTIYR
jgi:hypothetical protein